MLYVWVCACSCVCAPLPSPLLWLNPHTNIQSHLHTYTLSRAHTPLWRCSVQLVHVTMEMMTLAIHHLDEVAAQWEVKGPMQHGVQSVRLSWAGGCCKVRDFAKSTWKKGCFRLLTCQRCTSRLCLLGVLEQAEPILLLYTVSLMFNHASWILSYLLRGVILGKIHSMIC